MKGPLRIFIFLKGGEMEEWLARKTGPATEQHSLIKALHICTVLHFSREYGFGLAHSPACIISVGRGQIFAMSCIKLPPKTTARKN